MNRFLLLVFALLIMVMPVFAKGGAESSRKLKFKMPEKAGKYKSLPVSGPPIVFSLRVGYNSDGDTLYAGCHVVNMGKKAVDISYVVHFYDENDKEILKGQLKRIEVEPNMQIDNPQSLKIPTKLDTINNIKAFKVDIKK